MAAPGGTELFDTYEKDYNNISTSLSRRIHTQIPNFTGGTPFCTLDQLERTLNENAEQRKEAIRAAERELDEGDEIVRPMHLLLSV